LFLGGIYLDKDIIEELIENGFDKVKNKLFKKVDEENKDLIDELDIKKSFETAEIVVDVNNDSAQIITYFDKEKSMINDIIGQEFNELIDKLLN
jgi:hypothetical protein